MEGAREEGRVLCGTALRGLVNCRSSGHKFANNLSVFPRIPIIGENLILSDCYGRFIRP